MILREERSVLSYAAGRAPVRRGSARCGTRGHLAPANQGSCDHVAPLSEEQRRAILYSKLAYRHRFREVLEQSGLMRAGLPPARRVAALGDVARALRESRDGFLQEARQHLSDDQQYSLLAYYEHGEFSAEVAKLQGIADGS